MLDDAISEIDVQDAEALVGELGPTFPVVRITSESTRPTTRQCGRKASRFDVLVARYYPACITLSLLD